MKLSYARAAAANVIARFFIQDSSSLVGAGLTGITFSSAGLKLSVIRELDAAPTVYTQAGSTIETITTLGTYAAPTATKIRFKEVDATNLPGIYEVHFAQALFGTGDVSRFITGLAFGATNMAPSPFEVQLNAFDFQVAQGVQQTGDNFARIGAPAGASIAADIASNYSRLGAPAGASHAADVAAVAAKTANLPPDPADASDIAAAFAAVPAAVLAAAAAAPIASNVKKVNSVTVNGTGTLSDPWGP